ncbi:MAG: peptidoglycan DD-metalloendopeptidase family protein [Saprospiraceae bacterium]
MKNIFSLVFSIILSLTLSFNLYGKTWLVGSNKSNTTPSSISNLVKDGDTILIDAGVYVKDVCFWKANHLLIRGMNGRAHLKSGGTAAGQKAIWVIQGDSTIVENIEFSECKVSDKNGAGIRLEGTHLVVRNCYFHHNEDGILAGDNSNSNIIIEYSEFAFNGFGDGLSHNLYINHVNSLLFRFNYSHDAVVGHLLKSRAHNNYIYYNRLSEEAGDGSYEVDLPNGGLSVLLGNIIQQGLNSQNSTIISYGKEGLSNPTEHSLYLSHNTLVNEKANGTFVQIQNGTGLFFSLNNIYAGAGNKINGTATSTNEFGSIINTSIPFFKFVNATTLDYQLTVNSPCYNKGYFSKIMFPLLTPLLQYEHPNNFSLRKIEFLADVGALESHFLHPFLNPIEGIYGKDFIIPNYVDWKVIGIQDAFCGTKTYDGHQGTDFIITGFEHMSKGVNVLAVDSGIVTSIKDGLFDMETVSDTNKHLGNFICIKHPGNYYTYYGHLKKNSIKVKSGDKVIPSQVIGQVGCSGNCTDPHVHFELWWDSLQVIDPFSGNCGNSNNFWLNQIDYDTSYQLWKSGLKPGLTSLDSLRFHQYSRLQYDINNDYYISYWNLEYGLRKGDVSTMQWFNEVGAKVWQFDFNHTDDEWYYYYYSNVDVKTLGICDHCKARYLVNGKQKDEIIFRISNSTLTYEYSIEQLLNQQGSSLILKSGVKDLSITELSGNRVIDLYNKHMEELDLSFLIPGIYIARFSYNNKIYTKKLVVMH